jgi:16S rRNA (adenine1518-N6/adenine1519-N6)-dimethyltransferase
MTNKKPPLGQHFLRHPELAQKIVACLGEGPFGTVVEIGPGKGSLTEALVSKCRRLVLVERDSKLIPQLKERFELLGVEVFEGDARAFSLGKLLKEGERASVVSNLPFYAQAPILMTLLEQSLWVERMVLMFQKEVAERIMAKPSSKAYGLLSVFSQLYSSIEKGLFVPKGAFSPSPKVDAMVLVFDPYQTPKVFPKDIGYFSLLLRHLFQSRRKTLRATLRRLGYKEALESLSLEGAGGLSTDFSRRPEELFPEELVMLADALQPFKTSNEP